jgi:hypothetical protein
MSKLEGIAVIALVEAIQKIGETFFDGDRKDDVNDVLNALLDIFGLGSGEKCDHAEEADRKELES